MRLLRALSAVLALVCFSSAYGAGTLPIALQQSVDVNGKPLIGALLYIYQVGTVATPQNAFQDSALTLTLPWPMQADQFGRLPMFYLADGAAHVRLTDSRGAVQFDYPSMLVVGASSGGGGGGAVDPTTIASAGDTKFRPTSETLTGWVRLNGHTIGNATSGATERANADTQVLFIYLWTNCVDAHCPVSGGRGATALADYTANKGIALPDWRSRIPVGLDDMGSTAAGRLLAGNVTSGGGDGVTTPGATGGETNHTLTQAQLPAVAPTGSIALGGSQAITGVYTNTGTGNGETAIGGAGSSFVTETVQGSNFTAAFTGSNLGSGSAHNVMNPFMLGTWYMHL